MRTKTNSKPIRILHLFLAELKLKKMFYFFPLLANKNEWKKSNAHKDCGIVSTSAPIPCNLDMWLAIAQFTYQNFNDTKENESKQICFLF